MFDEHLEQIQSQALRAYPREAIWLITDEGCQQVENIHPLPEENFEVAKQVMARAYAKNLAAIVHSHPDGHACPSKADMQSQVISDVPWGVLAVTEGGATPIEWWGVDSPEPLVGRGFCHGVRDCYSLIRDYYFREFGIRLKEYPRDWEWWLNGETLYEGQFREAGFRVIDQDDAQPGDLWLAQIRSETPNHGGVLLPNDLTLHHPAASRPVDAERISRREPVYRWLPHITHWLRYEAQEP